MSTRVYTRNKQFSIWLLRILFVLMVAAFIDAGRQHMVNLQYLIAVVFLGAVFIPVRTITIYQDKVVITRLTFFGFIYKSIDCVNIRVYRKKDNLEGAGADVDLHDLVGCLALLIAWLPIYTYQWMEADCEYSKERRATERVSVSDNEVKILKDTFRVNVQPGK